MIINLNPSNVMDICYVDRCRLVSKYLVVASWNLGARRQADIVIFAKIKAFNNYSFGLFQ